MDTFQKECMSYSEFELRANRDPGYSYSPVKFGGFEWSESESNFGILTRDTHNPEDATAGIRMPSCTIAQLSNRPSCPLRIVFAPLDLPNPQTVEDLLALYKLYSIPGAFVAERLHNVACSFGSTREKEDSWFHFLCKNIPVEEGESGTYVVNKNRRDLEDFSQADFSWVRSGYCLKTKPPGQNQEWSEVTLIAFGAEKLLWDKFDALCSNTSWQEILEDPCSLLDVVFEVLYTRLDGLAWDLARVYSQEEEKILKSAAHPGSAADRLDFVGLHILSKHQIYLSEATEAVMETLNSVTTHHERFITKLPPAISAVRESLRHRKTLFKSTELRLKSLEKRIQNMINLSFNLVTQADSKTMRVDSNAMKTISVMTLIFLPCTAVATIFGTPFFYLGANNEGPLGVSPYFWLIWAVSVPLTMLVMFAWHRHQKKHHILIVGATQPVMREVV